MDHNLPGSTQANAACQWGDAETYHRQATWKDRNMINWRRIHLQHVWQGESNMGLTSLWEHQDNPFPVKKKLWSQICVGIFRKQKMRTVMTMQRFLLQNWSFASRWNTAWRTTNSDLIYELGIPFIALICLWIVLPDSFSTTKTYWATLRISYSSIKGVTTAATVWKSNEQVI